MGERDWASDLQGVEAPWPLALAQKDTRRDIKLQKIPRDAAENGKGEADAQGPGDRRTQHKPFGAGRGMGHQSRLDGGGVRCAGDGGRQKK